MRRRIDNNTEITKALNENHICQWELADKLGMADTTLCRKMRHKLPDDEMLIALNAIDEIVEERKWLAELRGTK